MVGGVGGALPEATCSPCVWSSPLTPDSETNLPLIHFPTSHTPLCQKLSIFSCGCSLGAAPVILALGSTSMMGKIGIASTIAVFGTFTTGLLQWFTSPYIQRLVYHRATGQLDITSLTLFGKPHTRRVALADVAPVDSMHPLSTFQVGGCSCWVERGCDSGRWE